MTSGTEKTFYRGVAITSLNQLIQFRLTSSNPQIAQRLRNDDATPGLFFVPSLEGAVTWAKEKARFFNKPLFAILRFTLSPMNFEIAKKSLWNVHILVRDRRASRSEYQYFQPTSFEQIHIGQICIDVGTMNDKILYELSAHVGLFEQNELKFVPYRTLRERYLRGGYEGDLPFYPPRRTKES